MLKRLRLILAIIAALAATCALAGTPAPEDEHVYTVVIDAGHGGHDVGCQGAFAKEKDITLAVAKILAKQISDEHGDEVNVVLTRDKDKYLTLQERADVANGEQGDLFISIHVNSVDRKTKGRASLSGSSVYTCGLHKSESNLEVAMRENAVIELEPDFSITYQGFDPASTESYIIFELTQSRHLQQSVDFASMAQKRLVSTAGRADKDVRQAGFWVLWATSMPAVLVELDFICNPAQEKFLASKQGQEKCAKALSQAFSDYYKHTQYCIERHESK